MKKIIGLFNHKGGVSKTLTTFNLGHMLSRKGYRIIVIDTDSQCNLTGLFLGENNFESFYKENPDNNIKSALNCVFKGQPIPINVIQGVKVNENLLLVPSALDITELDLSLGMAHNLSSTLPVLESLPGAFNEFIERMVARENADFVLIDMNPSLSEINKNLLMISDYFIIPTAPDYFSSMALNTLSDVIPKWKKWAVSARSMFSNSTYPFPKRDPKLLGIVMQNYTIRNGKASAAFQEKIDSVIERLKGSMLPAFEPMNLLLQGDRKDKLERLNYCIAMIPDFQSLIAKMEADGLPFSPVFEIPVDRLGQGTVKDNYLIKKELFFEIFDKLADLIVEITND